jgi:hypothetical protein
LPKECQSTETVSAENSNKMAELSVKLLANLLEKPSARLSWKLLTSLPVMQLEQAKVVIETKLK